jgi:hypothetical protein
VEIIREEGEHPDEREQRAACREANGLTRLRERNAD